MCRVGDRFVLCGIVSGGNKLCREKEIPAFYTRISTYTRWIENVIRKDEECEEGFECVSNCKDIDVLKKFFSPDEFRKIYGQKVCDTMTVDTQKHCCKKNDR